LQHSDACYEIFKARKLDFKDDLVPGTKDISTAFSNPMEVLGVDFAPPCSHAQEMYLTAAEDNLTIRGVNMYGEKQWLLISDRFLPDRSVNIISHRYAKLTTMIFQAHGVPIRPDGSLPPLKKVTMIANANYNDLHSLTIVPAPPQASLRKWSIEEDVALLNAAKVLGTMWAEISNRVLPHRDRGHLRKRYQVLERRIKATCCRDEKNGTSSWRAKVKQTRDNNNNRRLTSEKNMASSAAPPVQGGAAPPITPSTLPTTQPIQVPTPDRKEQAAPMPLTPGAMGPTMQYIPMQNMVPMFQHYPPHGMSPNYPQMAQHPYGWFYPPPNFMPMGTPPRQQVHMTGNHPPLQQHVALLSPSKQLRIPDHDTTRAAVVDELLREGGVGAHGGAENSLAAVEKLIRDSSNSDTLDGACTQQSLFSGVMKLAGSDVGLGKAQQPPIDPSSLTTTIANHHDKSKTTTSPRPLTPPCYFPSPSATVGTFGPADSNLAEFSRPVAQYQLFSAAAATASTINEVNAEQLEAASALSALSRSPALKQAAERKEQSEQSKPTRSLFSLVTGREGTQAKSKRGEKTGQPPAKRKKTTH
jgi:hypothetical protein